MSVGQAQRQIDSREFAEWMARERQEPRGRERGDIQAALIASVIANVNRGKRQRPFKLKDFLLSWMHKGTRRQTVEEQRAIFSAFAQAHNAVESVKKKK